MTNSWESDQLEEALLNLYSSWEAPISQENYPLESTPVDSRRKTSTDGNFLRESVAINPPIRHFSWPPRYPSQEAENISLDHKFLNPQRPLLARDLEDEVFEEIEEESDREDLDNCLESILTDKFTHLLAKNTADTEKGAHTKAKMDENTYNERFRVVRREERKVKSEIRLFLPEQLSPLDIPNYENRLSEVRKQLKQYDDAVSELVMDLEDKDPADARIEALDNEQKEIEKMDLAG